MVILEIIEKKTNGGAVTRNDSAGTTGVGKISFATKIGKQSFHFNTIDTF